MEKGSGARRITLGRLGEDLAARLMVEKGYTLLERNFRFGRGEIDLIARDGATLVFVEVKTRRGTGLGHPAERVTATKQARLRSLALLYLKYRSLGAETPLRFDVVAIVLEKERPPRLDHLEGAF